MEGIDKKKNLLSSIPCGTDYPTCRFIKDAHVSVMNAPSVESQLKKVINEFKSLNLDAPAAPPADSAQPQIQSRARSTWTQRLWSIRRHSAAYPSCCIPRIKSCSGDLPPRLATFRLKPGTCSIQNWCGRRWRQQEMPASSWCRTVGASEPGLAGRNLLSLSAVRKTGGMESHPPWCPPARQAAHGRTRRCCSGRPQACKASLCPRKRVGSDCQTALPSIPLRQAP